MAGPGLTPSGNIVEVNNVPTDHQPNPRTEDVRIGRLDGVGHETRLVRYLPPSRERICTLRHKKILRAPSQDMKELHPQAEGLAQWPNSFWTAPSASIRDEAEEKEFEGRGQGSSSNRAHTQTKKKSPSAKRTVAFLDAKRFEPDVGYRPVEGDHKNEGSAWAAGPSNYRQTNVSMVPAEIEALPESEVLVSTPPPNCEYTIIAEVLSDYMRHNQGMAIAFRLLGQKMADRDFDCKRDVGIVKMKYMLIKARSHIGFGWTDDADAGASWVWLWDAEKPYRAPSCPTEQWQAFRASRSGWEPPGLKEGMGNVMRGGAGLKPPRKEASKAHWATVARGWERERDLGREAERKRERDWVEERGSSSRSAISCGPGTSGDETGPEKKSGTGDVVETGRIRTLLEKRINIVDGHTQGFDLASSP
ncbi:unnamed protein product [Tilletia caries]|nr:unnamed protein product [Tilletia caries]CAD6967054.1 unnamed protein product [Tilletia controversa]CAD6968363.1 unnamed protein product [Tilletia controversa]CAD7061661.1 unnamed protein product [Tilletia caries]